MRLTPMIAAAATALAVAACQNNTDDAATGEDATAAAADTGMDVSATAADNGMAADGAAGSGASADAGGAASGRSGQAGSQSLNGPAGRNLNDGAMAPAAGTGSGADGTVDPANQTDTERRLNPQQNSPGY